MGLFDKLRRRKRRTLNPSLRPSEQIIVRPLSDLCCWNGKTVILSFYPQYAEGMEYSD